MTPLLALRDLTVTYGTEAGGLTAVRAVSFDLAADRLSVITDDGHSPSARLEREDDRRLESVRVLILVDENMIEPALTQRE